MAGSITHGEAGSTLVHGADRDAPLADPLRRRDDVIAAVARDLRDPIDALRAEVGRLVAGAAGPLADGTRAALAGVERQLSSLADVQQDLQALHELQTRRPELRRSRVDLSALCGRVCARLEPLAADRDLVLERDLPPFPVTAQADGERLLGALENLATRGASMMPPRSRLVLRVEPLPWGGRLVLELRGPAGGPLAFSAGGAVANALFAEIVECCGGTLDILGCAARVSFFEDAREEAQRAASGRPRLLVVEDDDASREALAEALADRYDVEPAADGVAGVEAARARRPDLVLMDLYLPRLDGFSALETLRSDPTTSDVPVILVSGRGDDLTRARSLDLGAVDFLQKPFSERELRARIERTLRLARRQSQLQALAETDALTGLANRRAFRSRLAQEVKRAGRYGTALACLMVDLDHLKPVNDQYGHAAGDRAIAALAAVLRSELRETDFGARYGGDEFVILLPHTTAAEGRALAERICERVRGTAIEAAGHAVPLGASFGIAELPEGPPEEAAEALLRHADAALYEAKGTGRARVATWRGPA
jgi:diguanylate cyclase (GGDEF)-like protein